MQVCVCVKHSALRISNVVLAVFSLFVSVFFVSQAYSLSLSLSSFRGPASPKLQTLKLSYTSLSLAHLVFRKDSRSTAATLETRVPSNQGYWAGSGLTVVWFLVLFQGRGLADISIFRLSGAEHYSKCSVA